VNVDRIEKFIADTVVLVGVLVAGIMFFRSVIFQKSPLPDLAFGGTKTRPRTLRSLPRDRGLIPVGGEGAQLLE
jgi:hypothetical protein